jgi:Protein of unknown function (DUF2752)
MAEPSQPTPAPPTPAPPTPASRWAFRVVIVLILAVAAPIGSSILYNYAPSENDFYPGCFFHKATGWHCPGCGATRCCHALLHLDFLQAMAWNPLFFLVLPYLLLGLGRAGFTLWTGRPAPLLIRMPPWSTKVFVSIILTYWVIRNIPYEPFTWLAPHDIRAQVVPVDGQEKT